ncbi:MAG: S9 family peptidase [Hyphomicrobiales bacterium]
MKKLNQFLSLLLVLFLLISVSEVKAGDKKISLRDIWASGKFYPAMVRGIHSLNDGKSYSVIENGNIVSYSYKTGKKIKTIVRSKDLIPKGQKDNIVISSYQFSDDESKLIIPTETEPIYRRSSKSVYYVYDLKTKELFRLSNDKQMLAQFSPDASKIAFARDNNIFIIDLKTKEEKQITTDGKFNFIINGSTDWVYEEEFSIANGMQWSPNGDKLAYFRFDESKVKEFNMQYFGSLYPEDYRFKYPKAGEDNSIVEIFVYDLNKEQAKKMDTGKETDIYLPRIKWTNDNNTLSIQRLNRHQNHFELLLANADSGESKIIYEEKSKYYVDVTDNLSFLPDNKTFIITSEADGYNHIYWYNLDGKLIKQLTKGEWEVTHVYGYDKKRKVVLYQSAEISPIDRGVYSVSLKGKKTALTTKTGTNEPDFSATYDYYINTWSDANTPFVYTVNNRKGKVIRTIEDNAKFVERLNEYDISKEEFFKVQDESFTLPDGKQVGLNAWKILPTNFDPKKKYPVLMYVYGGPGSQQVVNKWQFMNYFWFQHLAQKGIMVVCVDNRGTGAMGAEFKKMTYKELGKFEIQDQITAAKLLGSSENVDKSRIAMFGWSYGGFMSTLAITKGADVFSTAIAVAPVTNWRYYDNIYTERFMRTPQENPSGYDENSPINHVDKLKGNYLLIHGSGDDNVHFQNAMDLMSALQNANKDFELMVYPNKNHGIYGGYTRLHLYRKMTKFLLKSFKK